MKASRISIAAALFLIAPALAWSAPLERTSLRGREVLGLRLGGVFTSGVFNDEFGNGSEIEIHFTQGLSDWLGLEFALSSHNFGESKDEAKNILFFDRTDVNLQMFSLTVGAIALKNINDRVAATLEAGPGFYSVNAIVPEGFYEAQKTDNRLGLYGGAGLLVKLANSVSLSANGKYHTVFIRTNSEDTVHFYTGEDMVRFFQISVGVVIKAH
ncbi:MAG: outer membrane beta-barrel protein [Candidatus Krumholzibacteria bacterium]|nr:outer membrane beta-barrel protein [Candidatus Krumholzibacteria bacterium]